MKVSRTSRLNGEYQKEISSILRRVKDRAPDMKGLISFWYSPFSLDVLDTFITL